MRLPGYIAYQQFTSPGWFAPLSISGLGATYPVPDILTGTMTTYSASSPTVAGAGGGGVSYERPDSWKYAPAAYRYDRLHLIWPIRTNEARVLAEQQFPRLPESELSALKLRLSIATQSVDTRATTTTRLPATADSVVPMATPTTTAEVIRQQVAEQAGVLAPEAGVEASWFEAVPMWAWIAAAGVGAYFLMKGGK